MDYIIVIVLVILSALFSGLTLGLFSLDKQTLKRLAALGDTNAIKVAPLREHGNRLLATLLLGNVMINTVLSIFLGSIASGVTAGFIATSTIFIFGEIIPQAAFSRHALRFSAVLSGFVHFFLIVFYPISFPIAYVLDKLLGNELPKMYSKSELMHIISEHEDSEHSSIDADEKRILHGALKFSHRKVNEVMTPIEKVIMFDMNQKLTPAFFEKVAEEGYSRYLVYSGHKGNIEGILYAKDLLVEDEHIAIHETEEAFDSDFMKVRANNLLDGVLARMLKEKRHIAVAYNKNGQSVGVITLEDIIEEILQFEIEDEADDEDA